MQPDATPPSPAGEDAFKFGKRAEFALVWAACLIAALRVFLFSAAFPFFCNVDEQAHFDMVLRSARGAPPGLKPFSKESAEYISLYSSPEFVLVPEKFPDHKFPPPIWMRPPQTVPYRFHGVASLWSSQVNHEGANPSLYYPAAALWWQLGHACGLEGGYLLYWVRFLNIFIGAGLVWLGYWAARLVFPDQWFPRLGAPALLAFFPQDIFYSIQSDVFSPIFFGLAFVGLVKLWKAEAPGFGLSALTGLAIAGTVLVKVTNLPLAAIAAVAVLGKACQLAGAGTLRASLPALGLLALCAFLPVACQMSSNYFNFGAASGAEQTTRSLGWTRKPLSQWLPHPLFTLRGQQQFWGELLASFWRGEFAWEARRLASPLADAFYCVSSLVLVAVNLPALVWRGPRLTPLQRAALWMALGSFASVIAFQALSSMAFDFGACEYPSRDKPFFTSGRLMCGALIPFLLLYVRGLDRLLSWRGHPCARVIGLAAIIVLINVSEIQISRPAFSSLYNFFHLVPLRTAAANISGSYLHP
jgi:hypothetical protein